VNVGELLAVLSSPLQTKRVGRSKASAWS